MQREGVPTLWHGNESLWCQSAGAARPQGPGCPRMGGEKIPRLPRTSQASEGSKRLLQQRCGSSQLTWPFYNTDWSSAGDREQLSSTYFTLLSSIKFSTVSWRLWAVSPFTTPSYYDCSYHQCQSDVEALCCSCHQCQPEADASDCSYHQCQSTDVVFVSELNTYYLRRTNAYDYFGTRPFGAESSRRNSTWWSWEVICTKPHLS